jgi:hypothetical protein
MSSLGGQDGKSVGVVEGVGGFLGKRRQGTGSERAVEYHMENRKIAEYVCRHVMGGGAMTKEELEHRRETCKTRTKLGYCNVSDDDCQMCKAYDYEPLDLIFGHTWEEIQAIQHKT